MPRFRWFPILAFVAPGVALGQADLKSIPDPDPELERKSFQVADGFEVSLYASDPMLAKPIQMNFDPQGRLWVAASEVYPQIEPGKVPTDKILVLEDRDGDGKADKTTVFADGLLIPTGVIPGDGGAYVANSTELAHFKDTDGDGKADSRRVLLTGFGTEDTHHIIHTFRWGVDGALYFNQSIYIHSHIETPDGVRRLGGGGIWRYEPGTERLDVFAKGWVNPWGHRMDRDGQSFVTDGAGFEGMHHSPPGFTFRHAPNAERFMVGMNPGSPKHCGLDILSGDHIPEDWQGDLISNDFRAHRVCRFKLVRSGSTYAARELPELIKTTHQAFRPIDVLQGPDGAIYVADWYNPIIQHGEVDFRDPRRDHTHGRIWRVTAKGRPLTPRPDLAVRNDGDIARLLGLLASPDDWTRNQARRVLQEQGPDRVLPARGELVAKLRADSDDAKAGHHLLELLWLSQGLGRTDWELAGLLAESKSGGGIRSAAIRILGEKPGDPEGVLKALAAGIADEDPMVRVEAIRALARIPSAKAAEAALGALDRPVDTYTEYALWLTLNETKPAWLPALRDGKFNAGGKPEHTLFALKAIASPEVGPELRKLLARDDFPAALLGEVATLLAAQGTPDDLGAMLDLAIERRPLARPILESLAAAARVHRKAPSGDLGRASAFFGDGADPETTAAALRAAGAWKAGALAPAIEALAKSEKFPVAVRAEALDALAALGEPSRAALLEFSGHGSNVSLRTAAVLGLIGIDPKVAAEQAAALLGQLGEGDDPSRLVLGFLGRKEGQDALIKSLAGRNVRRDVAQAANRALSSSGRNPVAFMDAIKAAGKLGEPTPAPMGAEREAFLAAALKAGDPARGEAIYRRKDLNCTGCHAIAGAGGQVGPGLESIGASAPLDYLADSLWEPNKAIKENYHSTVVATADGEVLSGIIVRQSDKELVLRDAEGRERAIPGDQIEERKPGGSLMPTGLLDTLTRQEQLDLVRFLHELGKPGPYAVGTRQLARRWEVLVPDQNANQLLYRESVTGLVNADSLQWAPALSRVSGTLPAEEIAPLMIQQRPWALVRTRLSLAAPGRVALRAPAVSGMRAWLDKDELPVGKALEFEGTAGNHTLTLAVPLDGFTGGLTLEQEPETAAKAPVRFLSAP